MLFFEYPVSKNAGLSCVIYENVLSHLSIYWNGVIGNIGNKYRNLYKF